MRLSASLVLFAIGVSAQSLPDAATLMQQAGSALKEHKTYQYVSEMTVSMDVGGKPITMTHTARTSAVNPDKLRVESESSMGGGVTMISDGEFTWTYFPILKQYTRKAALGGPESIMRSFGLGKMPDMTKLKEATRTLRAEAIEVDGEKRDCWVLETKLERLPLPAPPGGEVLDIVMTRWLDKSLLMDLRSEMTGTMELGSTKTTMDQKMRIHGIKLDESLSDSLFTFIPPAGAKEVDGFAGPGAKKSDMEGKASPDFHLTSLQGSTLDLTALKGKPILLDFWTTWCGPCRKDLPFLNAIYKEYKEQGLVVIGVNGGEKRDVVEKFLQTEPIAYPIALADGSDTLATFEINAFPTYVLIGPDRKIAAHQIGSAGEQGLSNLLTKVGLKRAPDK